MTPEYNAPYLPSYNSWEVIGSGFLDRTNRTSLTRGATQYDQGYIWFEVGGPTGSCHAVYQTRNDHYVYIMIELEGGQYVRIPVGRNGPPTYESLESGTSTGTFLRRRQFVRPQECHQTPGAPIMVELPNTLPPPGHVTNPGQLPPIPPPLLTASDVQPTTAGTTTAGPVQGGTKSTRTRRKPTKREKNVPKQRKQRRQTRHTGPSRYVISKQEQVVFPDTKQQYRIVKNTPKRSRNFNKTNTPHTQRF